MLRAAIALAVGCLLALAAPAAAACGSAQILVNGKCVACGLGQVANEDGTACITCPDRYVKVPDSYTAANAACELATEACGTSQFAQNGRCAYCGNGQVRNADGNGCAVCPSPTVKVPDAYNVRDADCISATVACGSAQYANNGRCDYCNYGKVKNANGDGCATCPSPTVKVPDTYNTRDANCVAAVSACGTAQYAKDGRCAYCNYGMVRSCDGSTCMTCPEDTAKVPDTYNTVDAQCVHALFACGSAQQAVDGRCKDCTYGEVKSDDGSSCVACPSAYVKVPDSYNVKNATCTSATAACGSSQYAKAGRCKDCTYGEVQNADGTGCVVCGPGQVKYPDGYNVADSVCKPASKVCGSNQIAKAGRCSTCTSNKTPNADRTACV